MYSNFVWKLVNKLDKFRTIRYEWFYKRKNRVDEKVETFKTRLVIQGLTQKERVDYEETFLSKMMLKSIKILLFIAASLDYASRLHFSMVILK